METTFNPNLTDRVINLLEKYEFREGQNYAPNTYDTKLLLGDGWFKGKSKPTFNGKSLLEGITSHPNYDGDYKIVLNEKHYRRIDTNVIRDFGRCIASMMRLSNGNHKANAKFKIGEKVRILPLETVSNIKDFDCGFVEGMEPYCGREGTIYEITNWGNNNVYVVEIDCEYVNYRWDERAFESIDPNHEEQKEDDTHIFNRAEISYFEYLDRLPQYMGEEEVNKVNEVFPFVKAHVGQKTSRIVNKICREFGFDKDSRYNGEYTKFADAINPLAIQRWTIISINPIDYLTMSFGNSWTSCHSIDKTDLNGTYSGSYHGCYSGGTLSYMNDSVSFVMYTVDGSYKGTNYELQPKINRQMFHLGNGKLIQGRMYPQDNDTGAADLYRNFREIAQRVISECFGVNNLWKNEKGTRVCENETYSMGAHYRDYTCYGNCNVSYLRESATSELNHIRITIGAEGICPQCGAHHTNEECILCDDCYNEEIHYCQNCGEVVDPDSYYAIQIGDCWYCDEECAQRAGYVRCSDGGWYDRDRSDVMWDDYEQEWMYDEFGYWNDRVEVNGFTFTCPENANEFGFVETEDDGWHRYDDCHQADNGEWYYNEDNMPTAEAV